MHGASSDAQNGKILEMNFWSSVGGYDDCHSESLCQDSSSVTLFVSPDVGAATPPLPAIAAAVTG
jgi:hypothetical protein